jgi:hypothetical protein
MNKFHQIVKLLDSRLGFGAKWVKDLGFNVLIFLPIIEIKKCKQLQAETGLDFCK